MDLGIIGLGKMGLNMSIRLIGDGHRVVGYDKNPAAVNTSVEYIPDVVGSIEALVDKLSTPRIIWVMVPSGEPIEQTFEQLTGVLSKGDIIVDGGNCYYKDSMRRAGEADSKGIYYLDAGVSGGISGLRDGYSIMVGGDPETFRQIEPILQTLAFGKSSGYGLVGKSGAGHFVKMIHNGIEYGLMQAYAEGFELLSSKEDLSLDMLQVSGIWQNGSIISSRLLHFAQEILDQDPGLHANDGYVEDTGEGRWTVIESVELGVPIPVISSALQRRFRSRQDQPYSDRFLAALRKVFGGHSVRPKV